MIKIDQICLINRVMTNKHPITLVVLLKIEGTKLIIVLRINR